MAIQSNNPISGSPPCGSYQGGCSSAERNISSSKTIINEVTSNTMIQLIYIVEELLKKIK